MEAPEHGAIEVFFKGDAIRDVHLTLLDGASRHFTAWLPGKRATDLPHMVTKICGLCPAAHSICSARAIEDAYHVRVDQATREFRRLILITEIIRNHLIHFGYFQYADILALKHGNYQPKNIVSLLSKDPTIKKGFQGLVKTLQILKEISTRVAGGLMPITNHAGGCLPALARDDAAPTVLSEVATQLRTVREKCFDLLGAISLLGEDINPPAVFTLPTTGFLGLVREKRFSLTRGQLCLLDYDIRDLQVDGSSQIQIETGNDEVVVAPAGSARDGPAPLPPAGGRDTSPRWWAEFPVPEILKVVEETEKQLFPRKDVPIYAGPFARYKLTHEYLHKDTNVLLKAIDPAWRSNAFFSTWLRLAEAVDLSEEGVRIVDRFVDGVIPFQPEPVHLPAQPVSATGWSAVEAPRGTLFHNYTIDPKGRIQHARILVPTDVNYFLINQALNDVARRVYMEDPQKDRRRLLRALNMALRTFDPCLSCLAL